LALALSCGSLRAQGVAPLRAGPPTWAEDAVWYVVAPDRFRNGDPRNDPKLSDLRGAAPYDVPRDWRVSPWTADWYKLEPWEKATGKSFYEIAPMRRFGGDLQGILERLDYLQGLGVTALLLNPIFEAPSAGRRDAAALHHVDNNLGPDPDGDRLIWATENPADPATWKWTAADRLFLRLVQECHRRQMKLVLDGVFDHVGATFWAFRDLRARGRSSRFADWFSVRAFDDPGTPADELEYATAEGVREWPELRRDGDGLAAGPRDHLRAIVKRWGDPNGDGDASDGIDGWRVAAADRLPRGFLRELRRWVVGANPEGFVIGDVAASLAPSFKADEVDATTNEGWAKAVRGFFIDRQKAIGASDLDARLAAARGDLPLATSLAELIAVDGGRGPRVASQIVNPDRDESSPASPKDNPKYDVRAPRAEEARRLRLLAAFQFASLGAPVITFGTEAGAWGAADPDNEKPMPWKDLVFEPEAADPLGRPRKTDPVRFDEELARFYQGLGKVRAAQAPLRRGSIETVLADDTRRVFAIARVLEADRIVAAFNASEKEVTLDLPAPAAAVRDLLSERRWKARDAKVRVTLPPESAVYLAADSR
jgi:glycosidase